MTCYHASARAPRSLHSSLDTRPASTGKSRPGNFRLFLATLSVFLLLITLVRQAVTQSSCCAGGPLGPTNCNVTMLASNAVTACPAGDSVSSLHPSRLYLRIHY